MCEILIFAKNNTHPDPQKDRRGCYKRGMPVCVFVDGHFWGREESKQQWILDGFAAADWPGQGKFIILKIPGVPVSRALEFIEVQTEDDAGIETGETYRRRRWKLLADSLPDAVRNALIANGEYTATVVLVRNYLKRIRDNTQYSGFD